MTVAQLSHLIPFLESIGARPKKSLSQNFLIDPNIVHKIVESAAIRPGDLVLEIGPGPGALTTALLEAGAHVTAIEKDTLFAEKLERLQNGRLTVLEGDFLDFDLTPYTNYKVLGNLPYSITTPILEKICENSFYSFTFMVQKELAERLIAKPGSRQCGSITIFTQSHADIKDSFFVSRSCFHPSPSVDSTVLTLVFKAERDPKEFFTMVRRAFQQRRKMITSSLKQMFSQEEIRKALQQTHASTQARPETLTLAQWRQLFLYLS
jgi:16S rRNA (adenine1518-N6/adenine1519-N6)-dimethyltransferase